MEDNEKLYLEQTLKVLDKKIKQNSQDMAKMTSSLEEGKKELAENYGEYSRGGDLSERYSRLADIAAMEEDVAKENKRLLLQRNSPYFGRIDFTAQNKKKTQKIYIGIGNVIEENKKFYVADWRAPVSSMYYDFNLGDASFSIGKDEYRGKISLKRQYKIDNSKLLSYFDTEMTIDDEILSQILSQNVTVKMKQIVSTIQKEQNAIVRNDLGENMLIQGIAGSGKTSIALHRAAYLLYRHRGTIKSSDIIIVSPNNIFSSYISEVLPQLGENNLVETTFAQIVRSELKKPVQTREVLLDEIVVKPTQKLLNEISYKSSYEYLDALLRFLKGPYLETFSPVDLSYCIKEKDEEKEYVTFTAVQTKELFFKTFKGYDLYERINKIAWQYAMKFTEERHYSKEQNNALKDRFKRILYTFLPIKDIEKVYQIFMAREDLTAYRGTNINYMDKGTYLAIKHFLYGFNHDYQAKYLIIDEMQDFTPVDIYVFKKLWNCPCIVVGDVNQCIEKNVTDEYLKITADFLGCKLIQLNKTYRSTKEIAEFANNLIGLKNIEFVNRSGEKPTLYKCQNQCDKIAKIINEKCKDYGHIAIICKCNSEAKALTKELKKKIKCTLMENPDDYNNRVLVTTCATAKGIEFDAVIIPNADKENYNNAIDKNIIYVSSTRALHKLFFTTEKEPSTFFKSTFLQKE